MDTQTTTEDISGENLYLMSNVQPGESGLPFVVYISEKQGRVDVQVKVGKPPRFTASGSVRPAVEVVAGTLSNRELDLMRQWIELNREVIIAHWEGEMASSLDVLSALKRLLKD